MAAADRSAGARGAMTVDDFVERLVDSRLYDSGQVADFRRRAGAAVATDGPSFAAWLVKTERLTTFQCRRLLEGRHRGLLLGPFEIRAVLGKGGMGSVFLAYDRDTHRTCALKTLQSQRRASARNLRRFKREIEVNQRLDHPGIARGYTAGVLQDVPYMAMEYIAGPTLFLLVRKTGPAPFYWSAKWIGELADTLDHLHQCGVVHRDLKPSNVIIAPDGRAKLLDLGLARWFDDDHNEAAVVGAGRIVGSFDYMAPEQSKDSARADSRSDVYALGCLLYFALAGKPPFHAAADNKKKMAMHQLRSAPALEKARPNVPIPLAVVLEKMMEKEPVERYQAAAEVAEVMRRIQTRLKDTAPPLPKVAEKSAGDSSDDGESTDGDTSHTGDGTSMNLSTEDMGREGSRGRRAAGPKGDWWNRLLIWAGVRERPEEPSDEDDEEPSQGDRPVARTKR
ncbi:MAG: serine/threonine-protein kinase [Planctomycetia bacterium]